MVFSFQNTSSLNNRRNGIERRRHYEGICGRERLYGICERDIHVICQRDRLCGLYGGIVGIVYEDEINGHGSAYFSVDRMGGIQYNTIVRTDLVENIFTKDQT